MQNRTIKKSLVVAIIVLFIGIGVAPSVTSIEFSKTKTPNSDLVEITMQLCKTDGVEDHKMFITQEQEEKLDLLIDSFKEELNKAETREETIEIYNDMVVSLDEFGLLPESTNCKEVQELVTGEIAYNIPGELKLKYTNFYQDEDENRNCLISGETDDTVITPFVFSIFVLLRYFYIDKLYETLGEPPPPNFLLTLLIFLEVRFLILFEISKAINFFPLKLGGLMTFGYNQWSHWESRWVPYPAEGWVNTNGLNGIKNWEGYIFGDIIVIPNGITTHYVGAIGFTGIKINDFYQGSALWVKLSYDEPT